MKVKLLFIFSILSLLYTNAQVEFEENIVINNSVYLESPHSVFTADLDGDGDMDVISASYFEEKIVWFENIDNLGGDFVQHIISIDFQTITSVFSADLDADGDMDVIAASQSGDNIVWFENTDGNGTFVQKQIMYAFEVNFVRAEDIQGDGDLDIVWSSRLDGKIKYIRNTDGLGTYSGTYNIESGVSSLPYFYPADIDGDDDLDIVSAYSFQGGSQGVTWYRNTNGAGSYSSRIIISNTVSSVSSVYAGDLDGDGDMDVVSASAGDDKIAWYENTDGIGTFGAEQVLSLNADAASQIRIADIDGDGDLDVISTSNNDTKIAWYENVDGFGSFSGEIIITSSVSGSIRDLHISNIDGDDDLDFLTVTDGDDNLNWYSNTDGLGNFSPYTITKNVDGGKVIFAEDLDGDGDKDILSASHWDDKVAWYENKNEEGDFYNTQKIISDTISGASSVVAADLDGDGDNDVIATSSLDDYVVWYRNTDGLANFGSPQMIDDTIDQPFKSYTTDIDNDGDMDLFCIARGKIKWYENTDGLGNFSAPVQIESIGNNFIPSIAFGDLDGDDDLDITACYGSGYLYYLNLDGQGSFSTSQTLQGYPLQGASVKIIDVDGDDDNDVVVAGEYHGNTSDSSGYVAWFENTDGLATFGEIQFVTTINRNPSGVIVADFDNDGDIDIASSAQSNGGIIAWYENTDGLGDFENTQQLLNSSSISPVNIYPADINNDGNMDFVSISDYDDQIVWHQNMGITLSNEITGNIRFDLLGDGCTVDDDLLTGIMVIATDAISTNAAFSQEDGHFSIFTTEEGVVNTQVTSQLPNYYVANPAAFQSNFTGLGNSDVVNFCIEPIGVINDLNISVYPTFNDPRPGFNTSYQLVYNNVGTTQLSGSVSFEFDDTKLSFLTASESVSSQTANSLTFDFIDLNPFETKTIDLEFNVFAPPITNIDDELVATATVNPISGDETEDDNVFVLGQIVIGSYDPNDITVLEGDEITIDEADKYLHYLIRFQNTGTASAFNVRVETVLDNKLDWSTMQIESLSHTGSVEITNQTDASFIFNNIYLPDSTSDEPNSHGYIAYKIKPKTDVEVGDIFSAVADIYFDFNPPVITNTATTEIVEPLSVANFNTESIELFPNPTNDKLEVTSNQIIEKLTITDINGRLLNSITISEMNYSIDVSSFSKGVYFLEIQSGKLKSTKKFIKN